ncbi:MAG: cytochrome P460 family protein, partial [Chitinophagaceae bacterium]
KKYASTHGWGWARWLGSKLKPYGKNELVANECINCHAPMRHNDYLFTFPYLDVNSNNPLFSQKKDDRMPNNSFNFAKIPFDLDSSKFISSFINPKTQTLHLILSSDGPGNNKSGNQSRSKLKKWLVMSWKEKDDPVWIGAKVPAKLLQADLIQFNGKNYQSTNYPGNHQQNEMTFREKDDQNMMLFLNTLPLIP